MRKLLVLGVTTALVLPLAAAADGHRKPGLWQITSQTTFTKGGPQMPQLTPDQLAKMQAAGVKMPMMMGGGGPQTMQICLTPEQAAKDEVSPGRGDCQVQNQSWSGSTFSADLVCHGQQGDMHGHFQAVASSTTSYTSTASIAGNNPHMGGDFVMDVQGSGQWQGADCGSVKPFTRPN
jgi:hypothetical protein